MKEPILYSESPIFSQGDYDVFVGTLEEDKLPMYVVINRNTKVVEFTNENTLVYKEWLNNFAPIVDKENNKLTKNQTSFNFN